MREAPLLNGLEVGSSEGSFESEPLSTRSIRREWLSESLCAGDAPRLSVRCGLLLMLRVTVGSLRPLEALPVLGERLELRELDVLRCGVAGNVRFSGDRCRARLRSAVLNRESWLSYWLSWDPDSY